MENKKTMEEILKENATILEENSKLKEQLEKSIENKSENKEVEDLTNENKQLKELNDKLQSEIKDAHNMVSRVLREFSTKTNDPSFFGDDGQTKEQKELKQAQDDFTNFIKNI